jgi:chemotaxis protein MotB
MTTIRRGSLIQYEIDSEGTWAISYGDMVTLLLTFFILFFNTSKVKTTKEVDMQKALMMRLETVIGKPRELFSDSLDLGIKKGESIEKNIVDKFGADIHKVGSKLVVEFKDVSFFKSGHVKLTKDGAKALNNFAKAFLPYAGNYQVSVRAYTDTKKVRPNARFKDNLELSVLRAVTGMRLMEKAGIPLSRLKPGGFGELQDSKTLTKEMTKAKRNSLSRKIVIVLEPQPEGSIYD